MIRWLLAVACVATALTIIVLLIARVADAKPPMHSPRFLLAQKLNHGLQGTRLAGLGFAFEAEGYRRNLSPYFLVGASGTESSLGAAACSGNSFNIWGLGACDRYWKPPRFKTWRLAIHYYADFVKGNWPTARTIYDLSGYCECGASAWGSKTYTWMQKLFGNVSTSILYR